MSRPSEQNWSAKAPLRVGVIALVILVGVLGLWGGRAQIAGAIISQGMIALESNRQVIQHPTGGVVGAILVSNGDAVEAGDVVLRLNDTLLRTELSIVERQLKEILARGARLVAERDDLDDIALPPSLGDIAQLPADVRDLIEGQRRLFEARRTSMAQQSDQLAEQVFQTEAQITGVEAQLVSLSTQQELIARELADTQTLFDRGLAQAARLTALQRDSARLQGEIGNLTAQIAQLRSRIASLRIQRLGLSAQRREQAITILRDLSYQEIELSERRISLLETLSRMEVRTPVSGVIHDSQVFALQSVISPAAPIMFVIPQNRPLVVMSRVETIHIDQVHVGQDVSLRFSAFDQRETPELFGRVAKLSADVFTDPVTGMSYYQAEILPNEGEISKLGGQDLLPGMPVEAFIKTAERSALSYLTKPLTDYLNKAWRES